MKRLMTCGSAALGRTPALQCSGGVKNFSTAGGDGAALDLFAQTVDLPSASAKSAPTRHLICLHALLGTHSNWQLVVRRLRHATLQCPLTVHLLDLRNHGRSPHSPRHIYPDMVLDLKHYIERKTTGKVTLLGHSMGGKLAMLGALAYPEYIDNMLIIDATPAVYRHSHDSTFDALKAIPIQEIRSRHDADHVLSARLPHMSKSERNYFLGNLVHKEGTSDGSLRWSINLDVLARDQHHVQDFPVRDVVGQDARRFGGKVVFFGSKTAGRMDQDFVSQIPTYFSNYDLHLKPGGHFIHAEHPQEFTHELLRLLDSSC